MPRRLTLTRETLSALTDTELHAVAGGAVPTKPIDACLNISYEFTCLDCITRNSGC